ncbi:MAG: recombination mediator RecR [Verrucomicrobiae bacterium]|nr:recombination mediator RecR [Verrucomicrobiae bacterium]
MPAPVAELAAALAHLPGIGPRSAERLALHLVQSDPAAVRVLAETLIRAREVIAPCGICGALSEGTACRWCGEPGRDTTTICVVEVPLDVLRLEKSGTFRGRYHVLGGRLSPLSGVGPEDLRIEALERRLQLEPVREVLLALGSDVEGDATASYLSGRLAGRGLRITRLALGLPAGGGLEFADELTLRHAIEGRRDIPA